MITRVQLMLNNADPHKYWAMHGVIGLFIDDIRGAIGMLIDLMVYNELQAIVTGIILIKLRAALSKDHGRVRIFGKSDFMSQYYESYDNYGCIAMMSEKYFLSNVRGFMHAQTHDSEQILQYLSKNASVVSFTSKEFSATNDSVCKIHLVPLYS